MLKIPIKIEDTDFAKAIKGVGAVIAEIWGAV